MPHAYGMEMVLDLHDADPATFTREAISEYLDYLCSELGLEPAERHFWDYDDAEEKAEAPAHLKGTSVVQFITTSSIVIHTLDDLRTVFVNLFSCGTFDPALAEEITLEAFRAETASRRVFLRGTLCEESSSSRPDSDVPSAGMPATPTQPSSS